MKDILFKILGNLEKEKEFYTELTELSTRKTDIIIKKQVDVLDKLVDLEQEIIAHIGELESDREKLVERLAGVKGVTPESITLSRLIEWSDEDIKIQFATLQEELGNIIQRQKKLNEINTKLIKSNLEYIGFALHLMAGDGTSGKVYEKKGQVSKNSQSRNLFDSKA